MAPEAIRDQVVSALGWIDILVLNASLQIRCTWDEITLEEFELQVTVNNLAPGVIDTDRNAAVLADAVYRNQVIENIPVGFIVGPDDCVGAALLLCSDAGRYLTGVDLLVDGGMGLPRSPSA